MDSLNSNNYSILEIKVISRSYARSYSRTNIDSQQVEALQADLDEGAADRRRGTEGTRAVTKHASNDTGR